MSSAEAWGLPQTQMFGVASFEDAPLWRDYDPFEHAEALGAPVVFNNTLPHPLVAAYSRRRGAIFVRPGQVHAIERCAVAHELVHWEHEDIGTTRTQEDRADRISTLRLIRPSRLRQAALTTPDLGMIALELQVTEKVMRLYARMVRNGTLTGA